MPRLGGGGLGLWMALLLGAGCDATATPTGAPSGPGAAPPVAAATQAPVPPAAAPLVTGGGRPGLRVDLAGTAHHVRSLERQPDGTYRSVCTDSPEAMRPASRTGLPR